MSFRVEKLTAFLQIDKDDEEGIVAAKVGDMTMPLIGADHRRMQNLLLIAAMNGLKMGEDYRIVEFTMREDVTEKYIENET